MLASIPYIVTIIILSFASWYSWQTYKKLIKPALSTWLIMLTGSILSLFTYFSESNWDISSGILNMADTFGITLIIISIVTWSDTKFRLRSFEKRYLGAAFGILLFWIVSGNPFVSNILLQLLMVIGYFPTIQKLIFEKKNSESFSSWIIAMSASLFALIPAISGKQILSIIYVGRSIVMMGIILLMMSYFDKSFIWKKKTNNQLKIS